MMHSAANTLNMSMASRLSSCLRPPLPPSHTCSWWSHLHGSSVGATWEELLEGPSPEEISKAISMLTAERQKQRQQEGGGGDITAAGQYEAGRRGTAGGSGPSNEGGESGEEAQQAGPSGSSSSRRDGATDGDGTHRGSSRGGTNGGGGNDEHKDGGGDGPLDIVPHDVWRARMRSLLSAHPKAIVGEVGVDRAAVIPGSKAKVKWEHQLALLREQLELAAELGRPVSVHCVRGYGHLLQLFAGMPRGEGCPPAVMLHSYGGSPEEVGRFCRLPVIGGRFFFSVSSAINARTPEKLAARIKAVPDDRLLIESDQVRPQRGQGAIGLGFCGLLLRKAGVCVCHDEGASGGLGVYADLG